MEKYLEQEVDEMADAIGSFIEYWGFKKIHGKVWCYLFLTNQHHDAKGLMQKLKVSKACMSNTLSELKEHSVIIECGKSENNTTLYCYNPDIPSVIHQVLRNREQKMLCHIYSKYKQLELINENETQDRLSKDNLKKLGSMIQFAETFLKGVQAFEKTDLKIFRQVFK